MTGLYVLSGERGVSRTFLVRWYVGGGCMGVSEVVVFYDCGKSLPTFRVID